MEIIIDALKYFLIGGGFGLIAIAFLKKNEWKERRRKRKIKEEK